MSYDDYISRDRLDEDLERYAPRDNFTCAQCGEGFYVSPSEPYPGPKAICDRCRQTEEIQKEWVKTHPAAARPKDAA